MEEGQGIFPCLDSENCKWTKETLNTEFVYYCSALRNLTPALTRPSDRKRVVPWIHKLLAPEYNSTPFRVKRNKYLAMLATSLLNDELTTEPFAFPPPKGALMDIEEMCPPQPPSTSTGAYKLAEWENDNNWEETTLALDRMPCMHGDKCDDICIELKKCVHDQYNHEFQFLLFIARPLAAMLPIPSDKLRAAAWLQALCTIDPTACSSMKMLRNDYIMALIGCLGDLRVSGPFLDYPPIEGIIPLAKAAEKAYSRRPFFHDPSSRETQEFLSDQPIPDEGAFCYIAVTGEMLDDDGDAAGASSRKASSGAPSRAPSVGGPFDAEILSDQSD